MENKKNYIPKSTVSPIKEPRKCSSCGKDLVYRCWTEKDEVVLDEYLCADSKCPSFDLIYWE